VPGAAGRTLPAMGAPEPGAGEPLRDAADDGKG